MGVLDGQHRFAVLTQAPPRRETAVADEERAFAVAEVAEDVGPFDALEQLVEFLQGELELSVVQGVDRHKLATGPAGCGLGVQHRHDRPVAQELERDVPCHAVVPDGFHGPLGVFQTGRHVDLPPLRRRPAGDGRIVHPDVGRLVLPAVRDIPYGERKVGVVAPAAVKGVVKKPICEAIKLILVIHGNLPAVFQKRELRITREMTSYKVNYSYMRTSHVQS